MIELLQQSGGFLIQTLPIACIYFAAFGRGKLRLGGRWLYLAISAGLLSLSIVFSGIVAALLQAGYDQAQIQGWSDMYFLGVLVFCIVLAFINVKDRFCRRLLVLLLVIYYAAMIYSFSTLLIFRFFPQVLPVRLPYNFYNLMLLAIFTGLSFPALYWFMRVRMREILEVVDAPRLIRACIYVTVELALYVIFLNLSTGSWLSTNFYMLVCYCISNMIMMYMFFSEIQMAWKSAVMEEKLRIFELKYKSIDNSIQETQRFRHDLRHHLGIISTLNSQGSKEELSAYLNKYICVYEGLEDEIICDYPLVNTILKYYIEKAVRENIRVTKNIILHKDLGFDFMDMTVLMGNSLENAIEANTYLPVDQRWIYIEMMKVKGTMLILIENSCGRHKEVMGGSFVLYLPEKETRGGGRGLGIESIRRIAEKYGGSVEFKQEEHQYAVRIALNIPKTTEWYKITTQW